MCRRHSSCNEWWLPTCDRKGGCAQRHQGRVRDGQPALERAIVQHAHRVQRRCLILHRGTRQVRSALSTRSRARLTSCTVEAALNVLRPPNSLLNMF